MKKLLTLLAMAMTTLSANAQAVINEIDWTQESDYYNDRRMWISDACTVNVTDEGLVIEANPPEGANFWDARVPIIAHLKEMMDDGWYQVNLTVSSTVAGELHLQLGEIGVSVSETIDLKEGLNEYSIVFPDEPLWCVEEEGMLMYYCGNLPGTHIIKKVQVINLNADQIGDVIYTYSDDSKTAEVKGLSQNHNVKIDIPEAVTHNGEEYKVTKIGNNAFYGFDDLISVNIPDGVTTIGSCAFLGCSNLITVNMPNSVTYLGYDAFYQCSSLTSLNLPSSLTRICDGAFASCTSLVSLTIPSSVTYIENHAFAGCSNLTTLNFLSSLTRIGEFLTYGSSISKVNIYISDYSAFCKSSIVSQLMKEDFRSPITLLDVDGNGIKDFTIPDGVTSISSGAFYNCSGLTSITIPDGVVSIGESAFNNCSGLTSITVPNSVTSIGESAFQGCKGLTSLTLPENLSIIKRQAIYGCSNLESITIPASVEYIYQEAFAGCQNLKQVNALPENPPFLFDNSFSNYDITLSVPEASKDAYMSTAPWKNFSKIVAMEETGIGEVKISSSTDSPYYSLGGIRTFQPRRGLYIKDGKKRIMR